MLILYILFENVWVMKKDTANIFPRNSINFHKKAFHQHDEYHNFSLKSKMQFSQLVSGGYEFTFVPFNDFMKNLLLIKAATAKKNEFVFQYFYVQF